MHAVDRCEVRDGFTLHLPKVADIYSVQSFTSSFFSPCSVNLPFASPPMSSKPQADALKAEADALFGKNDYAGAYTKYTEAIQHDRGNAVLYCNRAASAYNSDRYVCLAA